MATAALAFGVALAVSAPGGTDARGSRATLAAALRAAKAPVSELQATRTVTLPGGDKVRRYEQRVAGLPVIGADAVLLAPHTGAPSLVTDATQALGGIAKQLRASGPAGSGNRRISRSEAIARAKGAAGARVLAAAPQARLAVDPAGGGQLVWRVELQVARPFDALEVLVAARTGRVVKKLSMLTFAAGHAKLYDPNPPVMNGGYRGLGRTRRADHHGRNTRKLTRLRVPVTFDDLQRGQNCLTGPFAKSLLYNRGKPVCQRHRNWRGVTRADDRFDALMAYYHVERTQAYLQSLGFSKATGNPVNQRRQKVLADFRLPRRFGQDNSFYNSIDKTIHLGAGGVNDAEDGDVVVHEYAHAIQDNQVPGFGVDLQSDSLDEGFGYYVTGMMTARSGASGHVPASYVKHATYCVFDWDGVVGWGGPVAPCGVVVDGSDHVHTFGQAMRTRGICAFGRRPDSHCVGEIWAHGLLDLRGQLGNDLNGRSVMDVDVIASQFMYARDESFKQAVGALVAADQSIYAGLHRAAICQELTVQEGIPAPPDCA